MNQNQQNVQASLLDRLIDYEPKSFHEPVQARFYVISQVKRSVIRDLENLLNSRRQILLPPAVCREVNNSLYTYGLKDFTSQSPKSTSIKQQLRLNVEKAISLFEPRLKNVSVRVEEIKQQIQSVRFKIVALLIVQPLKVPITFDMFFDVNKCDYVIKE